MNPSNNNQSKNVFPSNSPPPYTSLSKNKRVFFSNIPINQSESTSLERTYQRVNESISSFQLSSSTSSGITNKPIESQSKINKKSEAVNRINVANKNTNSMIHTRRKTNAIPTENSLNEGLERIELSLQQLIGEAQESLKTGLLGSSHFVQQKTQKWFQSESEDEDQHLELRRRPTRPPSYQRGQRLFRQSQERLNIAFQQLDESVQNISSKPNVGQNNQDEKKERQRANSSVTRDTSTTIHHIHNIEDRSLPDRRGTNSRKYKAWLIGLAILIILGTMRPLSKFRYDILIVASSITLYRRKMRQQNKNHSVVNVMDRLVIRFALRKEIPSILGWAHRANFMFRFSRVIRAFRL